MKTLLIYGLAAIAEIAGCFSFWAWLKLHQSPLWTIAGVFSLVVFAWLLTLVDTEYAGRAYAAYGAIYIVASIGWLALVEHKIPDRWDITGLIICLIGSGLILFGPRSV
ncbi:MAG: YnfA family protein [Asticcacaulis sp.]